MYKSNQQKRALIFRKNANYNFQKTEKKSIHESNVTKAIKNFSKMLLFYFKFKFYDFRPGKNR